jgi:hypothetical protein
MISSMEQGASEDLAAIDMAGNLGIRGALSSASSRKMKKDIVPYSDDPLAVIRSVAFVRFRYKAEPESSHTHVGFIAEDTPTDLSGAGHNSFLINNSLAVNMAATQALDREVRELREEVRQLKAQEKRLASAAESRSAQFAQGRSEIRAANTSYRE